MQHIVISRFNVRMRDHAPRTEDWLRRRLDLFRAFAVPSMRSQSSACTRWLIFCDVGSPAWFEPSLSETLAGNPEAEPVWTDQPFWDCVRVEIAQRVEGHGKLITTRLDTDDAIARDYLRAVQEAARNVPFGAVNFLHGAQLLGTRVYRRSDPSNPFISFVEESSREPLTVFVDEHHVLDRHGPVLQVRTAPLWLQSIHDNNITSTLGGIRTSAHRVLRDFDLPVSPDETALEVAVDSVRTALRMGVRVFTAPHRLRWAWQVIVRRGSRGRRQGK